MVENTNVFACLWFKLQTDAGMYRREQAGGHTHTQSVHCYLDLHSKWCEPEHFFKTSNMQMELSGSDMDQWMVLTQLWPKHDQ